YRRWPVSGRSTFLERFEQGVELGPGLTWKGVRIDLVDVYWVAHDDDPHHAHCGLRLAGDHIDSGHRKHHLDVLAHLGVERLGAFWDHAQHRVDVMPLVDGDEVDGFSGVDVHDLGRENKKVRSPAIEHLHLNLSALCGTRNRPSDTEDDCRHSV